ncbi:rRNA maturation RNase YbeY [Saccharibacter sp. 17.LH.SD]|uniref:rRNA maturation RNase YbeY n=1 Tax=Saccharibacter sp. 17.LH.SD TaxID=2689393 RepID=UPI00136D79A4|nr:rRNA maturation RNase YbeY [Saccharibacter sp. 17.LH.SD]MXV44508.1 rRNA maturation RNase YbeY [Saccharibacter sp. 17.LH.SD]
MIPRHRTAPTDLVIEAPQWRATLNNLERIVQHTYQMALRYGDINASNTPPPTLVFSDNRRVKQLNFRFRGRNKPTNVLTFDAFPPHHGGDIVFAFETIKKEAEVAHRSFQAHLTHLLLHGVLHLAGHDHHHPGEAQRMEMREAYILRRMGYANPWKQGGKIGQ